MKTEKPKVIDKRTLEAIFADQAEELESKKSLSFCSRRESDLVDLSSPQAQVVIGVRRSGKSTLCFQSLENAGVKYAYADFDDERLSGLSANQLNDVLEILYKINGDFNYLFLDEIQNIEGWHLFVNRLLRKNMHVVLTGSNANLLSSDLATYLTGRNKEINLYPFSFSEYCEKNGVDIQKRTTKGEAFRRAAFDEYLSKGGFPEKLIMVDDARYVGNLVDNILRRDIEQRYRITHKDGFERMAHHLLNISPAFVDIQDLMELTGIQAPHTVRNYVKHLKDAFLLIEVKKYSAKSRQRMAQEKVYAVDVAMMDERENAFSGTNFGWRLETVVLVELKRRCKITGMDIYYLKERSSECDFIVCKGNVALQAIQVSYDITSTKTRRREINGLLTAANLTGCDNLLLLTDCAYEDIEAGGHKIKIRPVYEWALIDICN